MKTNLTPLETGGQTDHTESSLRAKRLKNKLDASAQTGHGSGVVKDKQTSSRRVDTPQVRLQLICEQHHASGSLKGDERALYL